MFLSKFFIRRFLLKRYKAICLLDNNEFDETTVKILKSWLEIELKQFGFDFKNKNYTQYGRKF